MAGGKPLIGLDMFHYAPIQSDDANGTTYGTSVHVPNITTANINFNSSIETFFADDGPREVYSQIGQVEVTINVADLSPQVYAFLIGANYQNGFVDYTTNATAPDVAIGFRAQKSNGEYRYIWLMKGKFAVPNADHQTKQDGVEFQTQEITFRGVARLSDDKVFRRVDSDDENLPAGVDKTTLLNDWFQDPNYVPQVI
jgi:phi13 family phage major tail protein